MKLYLAEKDEEPFPENFVPDMIEIDDEDYVANRLYVFIGNYNDGKLYKRALPFPVTPDKLVSHKIGGLK